MTEHMNMEEQDAILTLRVEYADIFYLDNDKLISTNAIEHHIRQPSKQIPILKRNINTPPSTSANLRNQPTNK